MKEIDGWLKIKKYTDDDGKPVCGECICQILGGCKFQPSNEWGPGTSCPVWHGESNGEWQPIETAPKDKREILLWCGWRMVGFYDGESFWDDDGVNPVFMVTAWAELPSPPQEKP